MQQMSTSIVERTNNSMGTSKALEALSIVIYQQLHPDLLKNDLFAEGFFWNTERISMIEDEISTSHGKLWSDRLKQYRYGTETFGKEEHLELIKTSTDRVIQQIEQCLVRNQHKILQYNLEQGGEKDQSEARQNADALTSDNNKARHKKIGKKKINENGKSSDFSEQLSQSDSVPTQRQQQQFQLKSVDSANFNYYQELTLLYRLLNLHAILSQYWLLILVFKQRKLFENIWYDFSLQLSKARGHDPPFLHRRNENTYTPSQIALYHVPYIESIDDFLKRIFVAFKLIDSVCLAIGSPFIGQLAVSSGTWVSMQNMVYVRLQRLNQQQFQRIKFDLEAMVQKATRKLLRTTMTDSQQQVHTMTETLKQELQQHPLHTQQSFTDIYYQFTRSSIHVIYPFIRFRCNIYFATAFGFNEQNNPQLMHLMILAGYVFLHDQLMTHEVPVSLRAWFFKEVGLFNAWEELSRRATLFCKMEAALKRFYEENKDHCFMDILSAVIVDDIGAFSESETDVSSNANERTKCIDLHAMIEYPFHLFAEFNVILIGVLGDIIGASYITQDKTKMLSISSNVVRAMTDAITHYYNILLLLKLKHHKRQEITKTEEADKIDRKSSFSSDSLLDMSEYNIQENMSIHFRALITTIKQSIMYWEWMSLQMDNISDEALEDYSIHISNALMSYADAKDIADGLLNFIPQSPLHKRSFDATRDVRNQGKYIDEHEVCDEILHNEHLQYVGIKNAFTTFLQAGNSQAGHYLKKIHRMYICALDDRDLNNPLTFPIDKSPSPQDDDNNLLDSDVMANNKRSK